MKVELIRTKDSLYGARYKKGEKYSVDPEQAKLLVAIGEATYAEPRPQRKPKKEKTEGTYKRRDMTAEQHQSPQPAIGEPVPAITEPKI